MTQRQKHMWYTFEWWYNFSIECILCITFTKSLSSIGISIIKMRRSHLYYANPIPRKPPLYWNGSQGGITDKKHITSIWIDDRDHASSEIFEIQAWMSHIDIMTYVIWSESHFDSKIKKYTDELEPKWGCNRCNYLKSEGSISNQSWLNFWKFICQQIRRDVLWYIYLETVTHQLHIEKHSTIQLMKGIYSRKYKQLHTSWIHGLLRLLSTDTYHVYIKPLCTLEYFNYVSITYSLNTWFVMITFHRHLPCIHVYQAIMYTRIFQLYITRFPWVFSLGIFNQSQITWLNFMSKISLKYLERKLKSKYQGTEAMICVNITRVFFISILDFWL